MPYKIMFSEFKKISWVRQPHLVENMEKKFSKLVQDVWSHKMSGIPKILIVRHVVKREKISTEDQQDHWLGIGMPLNLVEFLCPNFVNGTRKLSKASNDVKPAAYKELLCAIRYELDTKNLGAKIKPTGNSNEPWEFMSFSNSDCVRETVSGQSINGYIFMYLVYLSLGNPSGRKVFPFPAKRQSI